MDITNSIIFFPENKTHTNIKNTKLITLNCVEYINPKPLPEILFVTSYPTQRMWYSNLFTGFNKCVE